MFESFCGDERSDNLAENGGVSGWDDKLVGASGGKAQFCQCYWFRRPKVETT